MKEKLEGALGLFGVIIFYLFSLILYFLPIMVVASHFIKIIWVLTLIYILYFMFLYHSDIVVLILYIIGLVFAWGDFVTGFAIFYTVFFVIFLFIFVLDHFPRR